jgi:hypothetical protein
MVRDVGGASISQQLSSHSRETIRDVFAAEGEVAEVYPKPVAVNEQEVEEVEI